MLGAFTAGQGYSADADSTVRGRGSCDRTGITRGAAVSYTAWAERAVAHPRVFEVLAAGDISESLPRTICLWTDKLQAASRDAADGILMGAAVSGLALRDLAVLTVRCWPGPGSRTSRNRRRRLRPTIKVTGRKKGRAISPAGTVLVTIRTSNPVTAGTASRMAAGHRMGCSRTGR